MGMCAVVIAIGPFSRSVADFLGYPAELFANTREGAVVTAHLFGILEGSGLSRQFALLLGISDPWDFNQHQIEPSSVDGAGLESFAEAYPDYADDVGSLRALLSAGFALHFRPEG